MTAQLIGHDWFLGTASRIEFVVRFVPQFLLERCLALLEYTGVFDTIIGSVDQIGHNGDAMQGR